MTIATLAAIITKVRRLTGSANDFQLTNAQIIDYINSFYLYDLPAQFRSLKLKDKYTFNTQRGIDTYPFDSEHYTTVDSPAYCMKREIKLFTDPWSFYGVNFNWQFQENFATGDGTTGSRTGTITAATQADPCQITSVAHGLVTGRVVEITGVVGMTELNGNSYTITVVDDDNFTLNGVDSTGFTPYISDGNWASSAYQATLSNTPIIRSTSNNPVVKSPTTPTNAYYPNPTEPDFSDSTIPSRVQNILITANIELGSTLNVTDDGAGNLIGDCTSGTIDYESGLISELSFTQPIPNGETIQIQYNPATLSIPLSIMFFQNQFTLRPVPDKGYTIELIAYRQPSQALLGSANPDQPNFDGHAELNEWWELLAAGASKKIYEDRLDSDGIMLMDKMLAERYNVAEVRTYAQIGQQRVNTIFADQLQYNYGSGGWGFGGGSQ